MFKGGSPYTHVQFFVDLLAEFLRSHYFDSSDLDYVLSEDAESEERTIKSQGVGVSKCIKWRSHADSAARVHMGSN